MKRLLAVCVALLLSVGALAQDPWEQAAQNGELNRQSLLQCWRFVQGWLKHSDPITGLTPRNLSKDLYWNAKDAAADNYPFQVLSTYYTDRERFEGRMKDMLETEQRVTNRVDRLPDDFVFETQSFRTPEPVMADLIFGASEYVKDGLIPVTELLGPSPWSDRMLGLLDDIWKHGEEQTEVGVLPSTSHEVCGEMMQSLARMYWMTGNEQYRDDTLMIADYFLKHHLPTEAEQLRLDDHGCEVIGGLSEAYYLAAQVDPARRDAWKPAMHKVLDRVLEVGRDDIGLLYNMVNPVTGEIKSDDRTDNWGYNYNAFLVVAELDQEPRFREAVEFVLANIMQAKDYPWEGDRMDGIADSLEGGLNLLNRIPDPVAIEWADYTAQRLFATQRDTGVIEGWHGDGNFARTVLMYGLWKSQGAYVEPWRGDLRVGCVRGEDGTAYFVVEADWPWKGKLRFDVPRHSEYLHIPSDYPRLNQFPEWFTVPADGVYETDDGEMTAAALRDGIEIAVAPDAPFKIRLKAKE